MTDHDPGTVFRPGQHNLPQPRPAQHWPQSVYRQPQPPPGLHPYVVHHVHHTPVPTKDVGVAFLLWFFLGGFGADQFYLNRTGTAPGRPSASSRSTPWGCAPSAWAASG